MLILCRRTFGMGETEDAYDPGRAQMSSEDPNPWPPALGWGLQRCVRRTLGAPEAPEWWSLPSWKGDGEGQGNGVEGIHTGL